jgi:transposase InsO family protein
MNAVFRLRHEHRILTLCRVLGVSRSSYYKRYRGKPARRTLENQQLRTQILKVYNDSKQCFGVHKIRARLISEYGVKISAGRVYRLMKGMDLPKPATIKPRFKRAKPCDDGSFANRLNRQFNPDAPNRAWVSDITYVKIHGKFCYVCVVIDLFARKLISWRVSDKPNAELADQTLRRAYRLRGYPRNVLFHSDRGCQYTCASFRKTLDELSFIQSFSKKGTPYDNAVAESFFKYLKLERVDRQCLSSKQDLIMLMYEFERFYNHSRPHSANDALTPDQREELATMSG